ncbi:hypothetical protein GGR56DRAFT_659968 [Xylariaceae sp. FL0804]|nr:hypothetical protein GGR56DRAFT_659968 [Xylariaceae sp. FL0804]
MASFPEEKSTKVEMPAQVITPGPKTSRARIPKTLLAILILASIAVAGYYCYPILYPTLTFEASWNDEDEWYPPAPLKRYSLDYGKAACWQEDGVWIKRLTPVEMSALNIDRFHDTDRALDQDDEDAFCARLRMYGASFWHLPPRSPYLTNWCWAVDSCVEPTKKVSLAVGFPADGGVWVLDWSQAPDSLWPQSRGLSNALTMDERCQVIKDLGGRFCEDIQACPEMAAVLYPDPRGCAASEWHTL